MNLTSKLIQSWVIQSQKMNEAIKTLESQFNKEELELIAKTIKLDLEEQAFVKGIDKPMIKGETVFLKPIFVYNNEIDLGDLRKDYGDKKAWDCVKPDNDKIKVLLGDSYFNAKVKKNFNYTKISIKPLIQKTSILEESL